MRTTLIKHLLSLSIILTALVASPAFAGQKILVLGDSLSAAYGLKEKEGWVHLLQQRLDTLDYPAEVINASISGETTAGGSNKIRKALDLHKPDIIIVELGGNDGLQGLSIESMQSNLANIINTAHDLKATTLLIGMKIPPNYGIKYTRDFSDTFRKLAEQYQAAFVPFLLEGIGGNPLLMQSDGIHANAEAQPRILANVWPTLEPMLKK